MTAPLAPIGSRGAVTPAAIPVLGLICGAFTTAGTLAALMAVLPLYSTQSLGLSNSQYARLLTLRMIGICVGVVLLGTLSDRFGTRRVTAVCMTLCGLLFASLGFVDGSVFVILIPIVSGLLSTAFVNLNQLAQTLAPHQQGRINTQYRAAAMVGAIIAPPVVARLLGHMQWTLAAVGVCLVLAAVSLQRGVRPEPLHAFAGWSGEIRTLAGKYRSALRQRRLMVFITLILSWLATGFCVDAFFAIRLTQELGASYGFYGNTVAMGSGAALAAILALGLVLDRWPLRPVLLGLGLVGSLSVIGMGLSHSPWTLAPLYVIYTAATVGIIAPMSIWIGRRADAATLGASLAVHKILTAAFNGAAALALGWLEPITHISTLTLVLGLAGLPMLGLLALLHEPARPTS